MTQHKIRFAAPMFCAVLGACAPTASMEPAVEAQKAASYARALIYQTSTGTGFAGGRDSTLKRLATALEGIDAELTGALPSPVPSPLVGVIRQSDFIKKLLDDQAGSPTLQNSLDDLSVQLERWVRERLLAQTNLESKTDDSAVYRLKPDPTCRSLAAPGAPLPAVDAECARQLEAVELRVLMKALLDGVNLRFVVGPDRREFSNVTLRMDGLEWKGDLAESHEASAVLARAVGPADVPPVTYRKLAGKFVVTIVKGAAQAISLSLTVTDPIEIVRANAGGADRFSMKLAASTSPLLSLSGDGKDKTLVAELKLGALELGTPWDPKATGAENVDLVSKLTSLGIKARLDDKQKRLELPEVIVGSYVETVRGQETFRLTVNPAAQGKLSGVVQIGADGVPALTLDGRLDVTAAHDLAKVAADYAGSSRTVPASETLELSFAGATGAGGKARLLSRQGQFAGIEITDGKLSIGTKTIRDALLVPSGRCLTSRSTPATTGPAMLASLAVVDCPATPNPGVKQ